MAIQKTKEPSKVDAALQRFAEMLIKRMEEMQKMYGAMNIPNMPKPEETLVINSGNALVKKSVEIKDEELKKLVCENIVDMAKLSHNTLSGDEKTAFLERNAKMLDMLIK